MVAVTTTKQRHKKSTNKYEYNIKMHKVHRLTQNYMDTLKD